MPLLVGLGFFATFAVLIRTLYTDCPNTFGRIIAPSILSFFALFVCVSYFALIYLGPGYLPYTWSATRQEHYTWDQAMTDLVVFSEQEKEARLAPRPPRSSYSRDARRIVLRADHFCVWAQTWVGIKNHRYFLLMTFYIVVYMLVFLSLQAVWLAEIVGKRTFEWIFVADGVAALAVFLVGCYAGFYFCSGMANAVNNVTMVEKYKGRDLGKYDRGWIQNMEEICGPRRLALCWAVPCVGKADFTRELTRLRTSLVNKP